MTRAGAFLGFACLASLASCGSAQSLSTSEAGVQSTLRALLSGQVTYSAVCAFGFYAPTFADLARPAKGQTKGFILDTDLPKPGEKALEKYRYRIEMTAPPEKTSPASCNGVPAGASAATFSITARPLPGASGRSYRIDDKGTLAEIK